MAGAGSKVKEEGKEQQMLLNGPHQQQSSEFLTRNKSKNKPKQLVQRNGREVQIAPTSVSPCSIVLEEGKDLPVFWNGENPVSLMKWKPSLENEKNMESLFPTIHDFLSTFVPRRYLRKSSMSLQVSNTKYINNLRMSDPFSKILDNRNKEGKPVTLLLTHANGDDSESGYSKFTLYIRELNGKRVLWNGSIPTNRIVAKLNQSDMSMTIENCLQNYVAKGYLSQNCQVDLVKECSDTIPSNREKLSVISLKDLVNTMFKGNSASIVIRIGIAANGGSNANDVSQLAGKDLEDMSTSSSMNIPAFKTPPTGCHWIGVTWGVIKDEVSGLVNAVETTMRDMILPTDSYANVLDKKRALETAIRKRSRVVDEVWIHFRVLQNAHNDLLNGNMRPRRTSQQIVIVGTGGDVENALRIQSSCIDFLSSSLIRYGLELELYDEENPGFSRIAGVGVGIAVVVAICTVVYYF